MNENERMNGAEIVAEYLDRMILLAEENAEMRARLEIFEAAVKAAEIEDAKYQAGKTYGEPGYEGTVKTDAVNMIFGWKRAREAVELIEAALRKKAALRREEALREKEALRRKEAEDGGENNAE